MKSAPLKISNVPALQQIAGIATWIAIAAPARRNRFAHSAYVPWSAIEELREELERIGLDWRNLQKAANK